jgi:subtilisin family serine protease
VYVGVIDEGIQFTHPDLDANVWTNPFDPVDGVDNDGNGYVDDIHGTLASFSNYGASTVDLGAPGVGINSTLAYNTYGSYSGTSMATPHVSGGAALYAATHPDRGGALKAAILNSAAPTASLSGKTVTGGRLNVSGGNSGRTAGK